MVRNFPYHVNHHVAQPVDRQGPESSLADADGFFQYPPENAYPLQTATCNLLIYKEVAWRTLARPQEKTRYISASRAWF